MNKLLLSFAVFLSLSSFAFADQVLGYVKKDGTVVQGYERSKANDTRNDNYSTRGNTNPYTGESGSKPRDED